MTPDEVIQGLQKEPTPVSDLHLLHNKDRPPKRPGVYAWWIIRDALSGLPYNPHPVRSNLDLAYVGIAKKKLCDRILSKHLRGKIKISTLRYSLAALLEFRPRWRGKKLVLTHEQEMELNVWQGKNLFVTWYEHDVPSDLEKSIINKMNPPLNIENNDLHQFQPEIKQVRRKFKSTAIRE